MAKKRNKSSSQGKKGWEQRFLAALAMKPNVAYACDKAHITRACAFMKRKRDAEFGKLWAAAVQTGIEKLEESCWNRAKDGVKRGVWRNDADGNPVKVEVVHEYSDTLAICLLKAHAPEKYRERSETALTGPGGTELPLIGVRVVGGGKLPEAKDAKTKVKI